ncbi:MAG TPA: TraR/DksA C4-type zinc finger protein [Mycobacteriales bacterium]|nr:TraR/DksA C4-type zinc finger protein [Mycobacteriales bacterium]
MDASAARKRLEVLLAELDSSAQTLDPAEAGDTGELSHLDQHPAEAASELTEQERESALLSVVEQQRDEVRRALARLDDGTYGSCTDCGADLPDERLDARPEAARCITCQSTMEHAR